MQPDTELSLNKENLFCYWHSNKIKSDLEKNRKCKEDGIKLYRVREGLLTLNDSSVDYLVQKNKKIYLE